jgi:hypothetical protein
VADDLSPDEARWILGRAAELDHTASGRFDVETIRAAAAEAGLSPASVDRAIEEARSGAIDAAAERREERRGVLTRGGIAAFLLIGSGTWGILEGYNDGDLIPIALALWPILYVRGRLRELRD